MTRAEHVAFAKKRAHGYLARGDVKEAVTSMMSDLEKHPETQMGDVLVQLGFLAMLNNDIEGARRYIDGFN